MAGFPAWRPKTLTFPLLLEGRGGCRLYWFGGGVMTGEPGTVRYLCPIRRLGGCPVTLREGIFEFCEATVCVGVRGGARAPFGAPAVASGTR